MSIADARAAVTPRQAWKALSALILGFFMILIDTTIVTTALPVLMEELDADLNGGVWVTSAYLLAYAVPLLVAGRLGDRFGPKNLFLIGLVIFTLASLACGLAPTVGALIAARAVQGLGAALLTPQSMSLITRMFAPEHRGAPMALWGATAGVATLVGPLLGGVLVDGIGWEWIFFVNVPVGIVCFVLVVLWVPKLPIASHSFDLLGVFLSAVGIFLLVFGIQQGESHEWGAIWGPITAWQFIVGGLVVLALFVLWQAKNKKEPLLPLHLFKERNFTLANVAITAMGIAVTTFAVPVVLYLQTVREFTPTQAALTMAPMSLTGIILAPITGKLVSQWDPKRLAVPGFFLFSVGMFWMAWLVGHQASLWEILLASAVMGIGSAGVWPSVSFTATRDLLPSEAGAGSGVFNTTRQIGSVIGSALIALVMQAAIQAQVTAAMAGQGGAAAGGASGAAGGTGGDAVPSFLHAAFATAYGQSVLLPAIAAAVGCLAALCFRPRASAVAEAASQEVRS
ncbi:DHA2 family efflux MFS transporter permease subunit [Galactobacter valiniphilus]|uniref:DHA2 family efflux MFS transporter permease subunit n=1 Tax=Galactobacter valiniphilus TaxID=2676122 RepID=UPI00373687D5